MQNGVCEKNGISIKMPWKCSKHGFMYYKQEFSVLETMLVRDTFPNTFATERKLLGNS